MRNQDRRSDDAATTSITRGAAPYTGTFRPVGDLSELEGEGLNGIWTLKIIDGKKRNSGTLTSWSLIAEWVGPPVAADTVDDATGADQSLTVGDVAY